MMLLQVLCYGKSMSPKSQHPILLPTKVIRVPERKGRP